jgi:hypothetical protein
MDIQTVAYHLEFYTSETNQVEHYRMPAAFPCPHPGERVSLHQRSLTLDIKRVVHNLVDHAGAHLEYTLKIFGDEVAELE